MQTKSCTPARSDPQKTQTGIAVFHAYSFRMIFLPVSRGFASLPIDILYRIKQILPFISYIVYCKKRYLASQSFLRTKKENPKNRLCARKPVLLPAFLAKAAKSNEKPPSYNTRMRTAYSQIAILSYAVGTPWPVWIQPHSFSGYSPAAIISAKPFWAASVSS